MKYKGMEGVLFQFIVEYMKDHDAKDLLVLVTDAMEESNRRRENDSKRNNEKNKR